MSLRVVQGPLPPPMGSNDDVSRLFDFLVGHPEGLDYQGALAQFGWDRRRFVETTRQFRRLFENDDVVLVCAPDPDNLSGPWIYKLSGDPIVWLAGRLLYIETASLTTEAVAHSAMLKTDGRTREGKKWRLIHLHMKHLNEDLEMLRDDAESA
jgi:hypothetical protein